MKKLVIFDLDGTLLNTVTDLANSTNHALGACGFPIHPVEAYNFFVGNGINCLFERALPEGMKSEENISRIRKEFLPYYELHNADDTAPYPGIIELLEYISQKGIKLAVASNKYQEATRKLVKQYFPDVEFVEILGQREGIPVKPDPTIVQDILGKAGVTAEETLYIGDSGVDMETASRAGVESVGVTWGFRPRSELEKSGACHLAENAAEIKKYL